VRLDGKVVHVSASDDSRHVMVSMDYGIKDNTVVDRIAERLDTALATGKNDSLFLR
jgi:hypothetical protein